MTGFLSPLVSFDALGRDELNDCLVAWGHRMGPLRRPQYTVGLAHGIRLDGRLVAVAATEQMIPARTCGLLRSEAFELARVCASGRSWCRVVVRLWRLAVFPAVSRAWGCPWAISYQDAVEHRGDLYRFDGWVRLGFSRSGPDARAPGGPRPGRKKVVWGWNDDPAAMRAMREREAAIDWPRWSNVRRCVA